MQINHCPICGADTIGKYETVDELRFSYTICSCCGCEFGNDDNISFYNNWIKSGCPWFDPKLKPDGWGLDIQIKNQIRPWPPIK